MNAVRLSFALGAIALQRLSQRRFRRPPARRRSTSPPDRSARRERLRPFRDRRLDQECELPPGRSTLGRSELATESRIPRVLERAAGRTTGAGDDARLGAFYRAMDEDTIERAGVTRRPTARRRR